MRIQNIGFTLPKYTPKSVSFCNNPMSEYMQRLQNAEKHIEDVQKQGREIIASTKTIKETIKKITKNPKATIFTKDDSKGQDSKFYYYTLGTVGLPDKRVILKNPETGNRQFVDYSKRYKLMVYQDDETQTYCKMKKGEIVRYRTGSNSKDYDPFGKKMSVYSTEFNFEDKKLTTYQDDKCKIIFDEKGKPEFYVIFENKNGYLGSKYSTQPLNPDNTYTVIDFRKERPVLHKNLNHASYSKLVEPINF